MIPNTLGLWVAAKEVDGHIKTIYHITKAAPMEATMYAKAKSEQLIQSGSSYPLPAGQYSEVRIVRCGGAKRTIFDYNPPELEDAELTLWMWGDDWVSNLEWDPKEWNWRRIGILADTTVLNYSTKRGYRVALQQNNHRMQVDVELEETGYNSKERAKFFNRIWHPYLPRKVSAMQWLILTEGLPVGAWRERLGLHSHCQLCPTQDKETLQHAFRDCSEIKQAWELFRKTRQAAGLSPSYNNWREISRGLMTAPAGPSIEEDLRWDTAAAFTLTLDTPWDILRAHILWAIWCQRVEVAFREDHFHLGVVLWNAWRNTVYCAMEAYRELFRHPRNEEKRQEMISCFQKIWTQADIFGRLRGNDIKWNVTPHKEFLPAELGAWNAQPIRIHRLSPSPDPEAEFAARPDFPLLVDDFLQGIHHTEDTEVTQTAAEGTSADPNQGDEIEVIGREPGPPHDITAPLEPGSSHRNDEHSGATSTQPMPLQSQTTRDTQHRPPKRKCSESRDKENLPPNTQTDRLLHTVPPRDPLSLRRSGVTSRPKKKCRRTNKIYQREGELHTTTTRRPTEIANGKEGVTEDRERTHSRPKRRCLFGPGKRTERGRSTEGGQGQTTAHTPFPPNRYFLEEPQETVIGPDRPTLTMPMTRRRNPFSRYKDPATTPPGPDPYRFIHRKLGITAAEFDERITTEIDELLQEIEDERRQALLESLPLRVLPKAECLQMLQTYPPPLTGALMGVYRWASSPDDPDTETTNPAPLNSDAPQHASTSTGSAWPLPPNRSRENANG